MIISEVPERPAGAEPLVILVPSDEAIDERTTAEFMRIANGEFVSGWWLHEDQPDDPTMTKYACWAIRRTGEGA